jgi:predicted DNA-binding ribbon-helix-helix protein
MRSIRNNSRFISPNLISRKVLHLARASYAMGGCILTLRRVLKERLMKSPIAKRSVVLDHHKTSISLEDEFWNGVRAIADRKNIKLTELLQQIDSGRSHSNLSSAIRVFVLNETRAQAGLQPEQEPQPELRGGDLPRPAVETEPVS